MIRALTVIGHGTNLLTHYIDHYKDQVDEIQIVVYENVLNKDLVSEVESIIAPYPNVKLVKTIKHLIFDWERVTQVYNFIKSKKPNDWWVISDIDELHMYPKPLKEIVDDCEENGWEIVRGGFIDRIGPNGLFPVIKPDIDLWEQFPEAGFFRYPLSQACPNKVCIMKGHIEITPGQHYAKIDGHTTWRWQGWNHPLIAPVDQYSVQVHHFKWDRSSINRLKNVADVNQEYAFSEEYKRMYDSLRKTKFDLDITNPNFIFENVSGNKSYNAFKNWNKLIKKIISI